MIVRGGDATDTAGVSNGCGAAILPPGRRSVTGCDNNALLRIIATASRHRFPPKISVAVNFQIPIKSQIMRCLLSVPSSPTVAVVPQRIYPAQLPAGSRCETYPIMRSAILLRRSPSMRPASHPRRLSTPADPRRPRAQPRNTPASNPTSAPATLPYVPLKLKDEMLSLHAENPTRWNATTLAHRFSAPRANVAAILKLYALRTEPAASKPSLADEKSASLCNARDAALAAWAGIPEVKGMSGRGRARAPPSDTPAPLADAAEASARELAGLAEATGAEGSEEGIGEGAREEELPKSKWWGRVKELCEGEAELDAKRKTTFAFIEVGKRKETRAVWLRDGATGKLRMADDEERRFLLEETNMRDTKAFL